MNLNPLVSIVIPTHNRRRKLIRLLTSIKRSTYAKIEIIVVDDASTDGTFNEIQRIFHDIKIIRNEKETLVSGSRNIGIRASAGELILFVDDDNVVDSYMVNYLVEFMKNNLEVGICAPLMLYYGTNMIWCAGIRRNMNTSRTVYLLNGKNSKEVEIPEIIESDDFPNCFLVRSEIVKRHGILFDEKAFPMHYEESDFCYQIRKLGYKVICYTKAVVWHDIKRNGMTGFESDWRTYYTARNRILFHKKYARWWQFLVFMIFDWLFTLYYLRMILFEPNVLIKERTKIAKSYLKGFLDGMLQIPKTKF